MNFPNFTKRLHDMKLFDRFRDIAHAHGTNLTEVHGKSRIAPVCAARRKCMRILREKPYEWSFSVIGEFFGGRDHSSAMHYLETPADEDPPAPYSDAEKARVLATHDAALKQGATPEGAARLAAFSGPVGAAPEMVTRWVRERGGDVMSVVFDWATVERLSMARERGKFSESLPDLVRRAVEEFIERTKA